MRGQLALQRMYSWPLCGRFGVWMATPHPNFPGITLGNFGSFLPALPVRARRHRISG
ncbi:hypothetical protein R2Q26_14425 [Nitrosomonas sp. Is37]|nr:hypothetical protein [Nitrosomonas sp. Is37]